MAGNPGCFVINGLIHRCQSAIGRIEALFVEQAPDCLDNLSTRHEHIGHVRPSTSTPAPGHRINPHLLPIARGFMDLAAVVDSLEPGRPDPGPGLLRRHCTADRTAAAHDPEDLATLPFVANMALREPLLWQCSRGDLDRRAVRIQASIAIDTTPGMLAAVRAGSSPSVLPNFLVADDLASGG